MSAPVAFDGPGDDTPSPPSPETSPGPRTAVRVEPGSRDEDRAGVVRNGESTLLVLADGAGGRSGGREAAEAGVARLVERATDLTRSPEGAVDALHDLDQRLASDPTVGETTAVLAVVSAGGVHGASVGDSGAWLLGSAEVRDLTAGQVRKPLLGTGAAVPVGFGPVPLEGRLLLASDGLLKYASRGAIRQTGCRGKLAEAADALVELVRLPSGALRDDVSLVLCAKGGP